MTKVLVSGVAVAIAATSLAVSAPVKKFLAYGWDTENITPDVLLRGAPDFAALGMDGAGVCINKRMPDGRVLSPKTVFDGKTVWNREDIEDQILVLRQIAQTDGLRHSMIHFLLNSMEERLAWDDDRRWNICAKNMLLLAQVAKDAGLPGLCLDNEDYQNHRQYAWTKEDPPYADSVRLARQRGREIFGPIFKAYPDIRIQFYFMLNLIWEAYDVSNPAAAADARHELMPAFLDGILDVIPPTAMLVDGCEMSYSATPEKKSFRHYASQMTLGTTPMISPENRAKYRSQVSCSFATYLDAYTMTNSKSCWYMAPMNNGSRLQRLERNLVEANRFADDYLWFWGEKSKYADYRQNGKRIPLNTKKTIWLEDYQTWEERLPGLGQTLKGIKDPFGYVGEALAERKAAGKLFNRVEVGKLKGNTLSKCRYEVITNDAFYSSEHPHSLLVQGCEGTGAFAVDVWDVKPGDWFGASIRASNRNLGGYANWRDVDGKFFGKTGSIEYWDIRGPDDDGWYTARILARVPEETKSFVVFAWASNQKPGEKTYFDDFTVFKIR